MCTLFRVVSMNDVTQRWKDRHVDQHRQRISCNESLQRYYLYGSHSSDVHAASEADARLACISALSVLF